MASSPRIDELEKKFIENPRRYFAPLANEYRKAGDVDKAIAICRAHLPQQPGHMSGHIVFGQALFESGQHDEAKAVFEAALQLDPENLIALRHLGDIARGRGELTAARTWYQRVLDADPRNAEIAGFLQELDQGGGAMHMEAPAEAAEHDSGWADINPELEAPAQSPEPPTLEVPKYEPPQRTRVMSAAELSGERPMMETPVMNPVIPPPPAEAKTLEMPPQAAPKRDSFSDFPELRESVAGVPAVPEQTPDFVVEQQEPLLPDVASMRNSGVDAAFADLDGFETTGVSRGGDEAAAPAMPDFALDSAAAPMVEHEEEPILPTKGAEPGSPDDGLGLEVMEFVPPSRDEPIKRVADHEQFDPIMGHTPAYGQDVIPAPEASTPAAFVTETMAELYLQQGFRDEALSVYRQLLEQNPNDMSLRERVDQLEGGARSSMVFAAISDDVANAMTQRQQARPSRSIRSFFGLLASRRAPRSSGASAAPMPQESEESAPAAEPYGYESAPEVAADVEEHPEYAADQSAAYEEAAEPEVTEYEATEYEATEYAAAEYEAPAAESEDTSTAPTYPSEGAQEEEVARELARAEPVQPTPRASSAVDMTSAPMVGGAAAPMKIAGTTDMLAGSVDLLFGGASVRPHDDMAAATLAGVFSESGAPEVPGRPTRAASTELSLDHVFREGGPSKEERRSSGSFSFDQFFAESAGGKRGSIAGMPAAPEAADGESEDIEQFNKWLEGLKKK